MTYRKVNILPMAGHGKRFQDFNKEIPKPLIDVSGEPMFLRAAKCMPKADLWIFICQNSIFNHEIFKKTINENFKNYEIISIDYITDGQARSCDLARKLLKEDDEIFIRCCDNYTEYNMEEYLKKIKVFDAIVFTTKPDEYLLKNINAYAWLNSENSKVKKITCKSQLSENPKLDSVMVGSFAFKNLNTYKKSIDSIFEKKLKINNEYYLDMALAEAVNLNFNVGEIFVNKFFNWGNPEVLKTSLKNDHLFLNVQNFL